MNPLASTILTVLQWGGYLAVFTYVVALLVWAIGKIMHDYWAYKTACLRMVSDTAPGIENMFHAFKDVRNGKQEAAEKQA